MTIRIQDFDFYLPQDRIARFPSRERDKSKLMVVERTTQKIHHYLFKNIIDVIEKKDFLVLNNSKVIPVKFFGEINSKNVEILIVKQIDNITFEALTLPAKKFKLGAKICFGDDMRAQVVEIGDRGKRILKFNKKYNSILRKGYAPLPPYIKRKFEEAAQFKELDLNRYQTVYSKDPGSIAAPTAGLHFTSKMLKEIKKKIKIVELTLNVGEATFQKINVKNVKSHKMGREYIRIQKKEMEKINNLKKSNNLIAVGTTSVRALETYFIKKPKEEIFYSEIFIYPGFQFQMVNKLITNFHLPQSSLFILASAFAGLDLMKKAYASAIKNNYRFFSYGDAMLII